MFFQQNTDNKVIMICLNPVQDDNDCVERGLFLVDNALYNKLTKKIQKDITDQCHYGKWKR
jgi:hypothetical protein